MTKVGDLQALYERYRDQGFHLIAIADEPAEEVDRVLRGRGAGYWIGVDREQRTLAGYAGEGGLAIPHYVLVDVDGIVVSTGLPTPEQIEAQLARVFDPALGRDLHPALAAARADYDRGAIGAAWAQLDKAAAAAPDEALEADRAFLRAKIERYAAWLRERAERALGRDEPDAAMGDLVTLEVRFAGLEAGTWAKERAKALAKDPRVHAQRFAWDKLRKAIAKELKGMASASARRSVVFAYTTVAKSHPDTRAGQLAAERAAELQEE